jgi:metal-sulfur cluster biosynthetic enzyme
MDGKMSTLPTEDSVREALRTVDDPEAGMDIVELGLVYGIEAGADRIHVRMTMTSASCPMGDMITESAREAVLQAHPQVGEVEIELVWEPMWTPEMMSEEARNFFGWK